MSRATVNIIIKGVQQSSREPTPTGGAAESGTTTTSGRRRSSFDAAAAWDRARSASLERLRNNVQKTFSKP